ncbi:sodium-extruding oxaloacetate decarboxylase subunit alpha [Methanolobus sp. WCC5]|uniref:sodium-extruding oxaloacetate decarboxylase subunit alpha n=1 Tax=Methanolobus sp. WCC5 TaxID=3125785 RepID=UPI0032444735
MKVKITETILRDAHQSLIATRMRTRNMLPIVDKLDEVGYYSLEMWGGATFDSSIRYLNEDPWERLKELKKHMKETPAQMLLRGQNLVGYRHYSDDVVEKFVKKAYENGIDIFRVFDAVNDIRNMEKAITVAKKEGAHVQGAIAYTISPVHTIEKYVELATGLAELGCDSICIKDMAGLISPQQSYDLVKALKTQVNLPVDLHSHCTSGMAPMSYTAACRAGVDILDTALSPFSWGTSQPPTESIVAALAETKRATGLDLGLISEISEYFKEIKEQYRCILDPISEQIDTNVLLYQIPGGMLSNLVSQLKEQNALDKFNDVLKEMPQVRAELGYPPLVTPTSQIVGTQAVLNVLMGERYKVIPKEVKDYVRGLYGRPPQKISDEIIAKIIGEDEPITCRPADLLQPEYERLKKEAEEMGIIRKEEDILTYILYPAIAPAFLKGELEEEDLSSMIRNKNPCAAADFSGIPTEYKVEVDGEIFTVKVNPVGGTVKVIEADEKLSAGSVPGAVTSHMQGMVLSVKVKIGDCIEEGDAVCVIEAMKMENAIHAPHGGTVKAIMITEGDAVKSGDVLMSIE